MYIHIPKNNTCSYVTPNINEATTAFKPDNKKEICWLFIIAVVFGVIAIIESIMSTEVSYNKEGKAILDSNGEVIRTNKKNSSPENLLV